MFAWMHYPPLEARFHAGNERYRIFGYKWLLVVDVAQCLFVYMMVGHHGGAPQHKLGWYEEKREV
jgi:hypothetical protein